MRSTESAEHKTALVLPGGGARGAFQVGVLKALAELVPKGSPNPFAVISGTSAGAINSVVLASKARRFRVAVAELDRVWANFRSEQVFRTGNLTMLKSSLHWLAAIVLGGFLVGTPKSLLDNSPLRALLSRNVRFPRIQDAIENGYLDAVAVTAASYASARSTSFFQAAQGRGGWSRTRRVGIRGDLHLDHLMASIAVPMIFPPVQLDGGYFGDGAMRQATPLSPAIHLGADRILVVGIRDETADKVPDPGQPQAHPSFAQIAGYMLDTLFMDGLYSDLERMTRINQLIDAVNPDHRTGTLRRMRPIDTMLIVPSKDLRVIAHTHRRELPFAIRGLLRGIGGRGPSENRLLSFLMFEREYTQELIELGYQDAMKVKDELLDFVTGADVPRLFAPSWIKKDLSAFHSD
ncbi:MAG: patatin-like phospholipase family protein [Gammaproteobacteria bacterium]|nr:patatin-like phospholipase family protein [Gammaproteobacteria bacterium]MDH3804400.1 patatin-like phospholipase family protein [Gammaproteobacteria bacterium]